MINLFERFDVDRMVARILEHIDTDEIAADLMKRFKLERFDIFFVVDEMEDCCGYDFLGMAYSIEAAREIMKESGSAHSKIFRADMGKFVDSLMAMGNLKEVR